jgi:hypothetical protein
MYHMQYTAPNNQTFSGPTAATVSSIDVDGNPTNATFLISTAPYSASDTIVGRDDTLQTSKSWAPVSFTAKITME